MIELVERLRASVTKGHEPTDEDAIEAADEIERLRDEIEFLTDTRDAAIHDNELLIKEVSWLRTELAKHEKKSEPPIDLDTPLGAINFGKYCTNRVRYNFPNMTLRDFIALRAIDIWAAPNIGRRTFNRIKSRLAELGLHPWDGMEWYT